MVNDSPFYGKDGKYVTSRQVRGRLAQEAERDVALRVEDTGSADTFKVSGRGILHLSILMENMRREGFEFMVGQPQVIYREIDGKKAEPVEVLNVDIPNELAGTVIEYAAQRKGEMVSMEQGEERARIVFRSQPRADRLPLGDAPATGARSSCTPLFQYEYSRAAIPSARPAAS